MCFLQNSNLVSMYIPIGNFLPIYTISAPKYVKLWLKVDFKQKNSNPKKWKNDH